MLRRTCRRGVVQRRPARLVDIGIARDERLDGLHIALDGSHHQRTFVLGVAGLYIQPAGCQQRSNGLVCVILQGNREPHLPLGVARVRVKAPAQQRSDCIAIIAQDGHKKVFIGTGPGPDRHQAQRHGGQSRTSLQAHAITSGNKRSKLRLVASATTSSVRPLVSATCRATWGTYDGLLVLPR